MTGGASWAQRAPLGQVTAAAALVYFVLALMSIGLSRVPGSIAALWLPNAAAICLLLARPAREWVGLIVACATANVLANLVWGDPLAAALAFMPGNLTEMIVGAWLVRRLVPAHDRGALHPATLGVLLAGGAGMTAVVGATIGAPVAGAVLGIPIDRLWVTWAVAGALGGVTVLPIGLALLHGRFRLRGTPGWLLLGLAAAMPLVAWLLARTPQSFVYIGMLLVLCAMTLTYSQTLLAVAATSLTIAVTEALGFALPPPASVSAALSDHLPHLVTLLPALLLAAQRARADEAQTRFDALYRHAPEGILLARADGTILAANQAAQAMFGRDEAALKQLGRDGLIDPDDERARVVLEARTRGHDAFGTLRLRRADGSTFEGDISAASYRLPSGEMASHVFVRNVDDRVSQQRALEATRDLLQRLADLVPGMLYTFELSPSGAMRFPFASRAAEEIFGLSRADIAADARSALAHIHPDDLDRVIQSIARSAHELVAFQLEFRFQHPGRPEQWIAADSTPTRLEDGTTLWYGLMRDVTKRRLEEDLRSDEQARTELALVSGGVGTWDVDFRTGIHLVNDRWCEMLGIDRRAAPPKLQTFRTLVHPDDLPQVIDPSRWLNAPAGTRASPLLIRMRHSDGSWRWIESRAMVVECDEQGRAVRVCGTHLDVTERVETDRLRSERDRAEAANLAKTAFMSRMSHELRTPLNAVLGFAQLLAAERGARLDGEQREQVEQILHASEHLLSLINDLLDLSRIEAGEIAWHLEPVALDPALRSAAGAVDALCKQRGISLDIGALDSGLCVYADRLRLQQVLINLLSNAVKYNRPGGWIRARAEARRTANGGEEVLLTVADSGRGMTTQQLEHLFEPFNRLGAQDSDVEGTGIGLTITRGLVQGMGGRLEVRSTPGIGSEFCVTLARCSADASPEPQAPAPAPASRPASRRLRVLYAEDNPVNVLLVEQMSMRQPLVDLEVAESGQAALEAARRERPDLMLVDMNLGDMTGIDLCHALQEHPETAGVTCVALSADAMPGQVEAARAAGFAEYLTKPLKMAALLGVYDRALAGTLSAPAAPPGS